LPRGKHTKKKQGMDRSARKASAWSGRASKKEEESSLRKEEKTGEGIDLSTSRRGGEFEEKCGCDRRSNQLRGSKIELEKSLLLSAAKQMSEGYQEHGSLLRLNEPEARGTFLRDATITQPRRKCRKVERVSWGDFSRTGQGPWKMFAYRLWSGSKTAL